MEQMESKKVETVNVLLFQKGKLKGEDKPKNGKSKV